MDAKTLMGKIIFINHDKGYATIEYDHNGKKKSINGNIGEKEQFKLKAEKIIKKVHRFHIGDEVSFIINLSSRGDKMIADCIEFRFNNALDNLLNKAAIENRFVGYLKKVDENYFVKETGSYIFFPLIFSPWEKKPADSSLNDPFFFKLNNPGKQDKAIAYPYKNVFISEFLTAREYFKNQTIIDAVVFKITAHGIFVNVVGDKIRAKISIVKSNDEKVATAPKIGDVIKVRIKFLNDSKVILEQV